MTLEQQLAASVEALERGAKFASGLPTESELNAVHAMLARVIRERVKLWRSVG